MGLITGLLTLPLAPVRGTVWLAEQIADEADRQRFDQDGIMHEILELDERFAAGEIDEAERAAREDALLARLQEARDREASHGG